MKQLRLGTGRPLLLGKQIAQGGEGRIFAINGADGMLAKVFHSPANDRLYRKLIAMIRLTTPDLEAAVAWPTDLILSANGGCVGFVMPSVIGAHEINQVSNPGEQRIVFPTIDYGFLIHVALNLARATAMVHSAGCVIGDLNERNVLVRRDGTVRIIDADSFQITVAAEVFTCPVGAELYTAPELRGSVLATTVRTPNHDGFSLAVLIFQLLMLGRHPFAGVPRDQRTTSIVDAIRDGGYAYSGDPNARVGPPPASIPVSSLGSLAVLFRRAFLSQQRPTAAEWTHGFDRERSRLKRCGRNQRHAIFEAGHTCPLCALPHDPMPVRTVGPGPSIPSGLTVEQLLAQVSRLTQPTYLATRCTCAPLTPHERRIRHPRTGTSFKVTGIALGAALVILAAAIDVESASPMMALAGFVGGAAIFGLGVVRQAFTSHQLAPLTDAAETALAALASAEKQATDEESAFRSNVDAIWRTLCVARDELARANDNLVRVMARVDELWRSEYVEESLRKCLIRNARISDIGPARMSMLASFGVETAADVNANSVYRIPGFGPYLTDRLLKWRREREQHVRRHAPGSPPPHWVNRLKQEHSRGILSMVSNLHRLATDYSRRWQHCDRQLAEWASKIDTARVQARAAVSALRR